MNGALRFSLKAVFVVIGTAVAAGGWLAYAEGSHEQTRENTDTLQKLNELWVARDTSEKAAKEARRELIEKLCHEGKLAEEDCPRRWGEN